MKCRDIVCIGDMHVGSKFALWRDHKRTRTGEVIAASEFQKIILACWYDFWEWAGKWDTLIIGGDTCDGNNRKEAGRNLTSVELEDQVEVAVSLLEPICKGKRVWSVSGTGYHQGQDIDLDRLVAQRLNAELQGPLLNVQVQKLNKVLHIRHGGSGALMYRPGAMDREALMLDAAYGSGAIPFKVDLLLGFHWHWFGHIRTPSMDVVQCPGWKSWFPMKGNGLYGKHVPTIGGVKLRISTDGIDVQSRLWRSPQLVDALRVA